MAESGKGPFLPWSSLLTMLGLAGFVGCRFHLHAPDSSSLPLSRLWAAVVTVGAVFLVERQLQNYFCAVFAAVLLTLHPLFRQQLEVAGGRAAGTEALLLVAFACTLFAWQLTFLPRLAWWAWSGTG